jgi:uncharacterized protein with FMN-binding domain
MKKLVVSVFIVGIFIVYCFIHNGSGSAPVALGFKSSTGSDSSSASSATTAPGATGTSGSHYKDGTYTGSVDDAQWGYVQVQTVVQNGKIASVKFLQYPNDRERSVYINGIADPELISEAIQAQSAQVDIISGATDSSLAFMQSLSDALSQAQA